MFNLITSIFIAIVATICFTLNWFLGYDFNDALGVVGITGWTLAFLWFTISQVNSFIAYNEQLERFEYLRSQIKKLEYHRQRTADLLKEFKTYLGEKFPDLEMEFFKMFKDNESDVRIVLAYPELKSHKTITKLVDKINELTRETNNKMGYIEERCAKIRYVSNSKWYLIKPPIPEELKPIVYEAMDIKEN